MAVLELTVQSRWSTKQALQVFITWSSLLLLMTSGVVLQAAGAGGAPAEAGAESGGARNGPDQRRHPQYRLRLDLTFTWMI